MNWILALLLLIGAGQNDLEDDLARAACAQGRAVTPDPKPQRGLFYRADHFSLAKRGVPTLLLMALGGGEDLASGGRIVGDARTGTCAGLQRMSICSIGSAATWATRGAGPSGARLQSSRRSATRAVRRDTECCFDVQLSSGPPSEPQIPPGAAICVALRMQDLRARVLRGVELQHHPLRIRNTGI